MMYDTVNETGCHLLGPSADAVAEQIMIEIVGHTPPASMEKR